MQQVGGPEVIILNGVGAGLVHWRAAGDGAFHLGVGELAHQHVCRHGVGEAAARGGVEDGHSGNYLMLRASQTGQHGPGILGIGRLGDGFAVQHDGTVRSDVVTGSRVFRDRVFGSRGGEGFLARQAAHHVRSRFVRELILWDIGWRHPEFDAQTGQQFASAR